MTESPQLFPEEFFFDADLRVVQIVQKLAGANARILDLDCGEGRLGEILKHQIPGCHVAGISHEPHLVALARSRLDQMISCNASDGNRINKINVDGLFDALPPFDLIVASARLFQSSPKPLALLTRLREQLNPNGHLVLSWPNPQHWSVINKLLNGDLQAHAAGLINHDSRHFLPVANLIKLFLDAGFLPQIADRRMIPAPQGWQEAMQPMIALTGHDQSVFTERTASYEYLVVASPIENLPEMTKPVKPVSFGVCVSNSDVLQDNFLASACLQEANHQILTATGLTSAAEGLNAFIESAQHELVVLVHQDVYLPAWWVHRLWEEYEKALALTDHKLGVMGVYGVCETQDSARQVGKVCDRDYLLCKEVFLPHPVTSLDEIALIFSRKTPLRFDESLGFHLYGTDICLSAAKVGLGALAIDAPLFHNSRQGGELPPAYRQSEQIIKKKWAGQLPITTLCSVIK